MNKAVAYLKRHPMATFITLVVLCLIIQFLATDYQISRVTNPNWLKELTPVHFFQLLLNHIADAIILAIPFLLLSRRFRFIGWIIVLFVTIWCFAQLVYYPSYHDLMPFSSFVLVQNANSVVANSVLGSLRWGYLEVIFPPILLFVAYLLWFRKPLSGVKIGLSAKSVTSMLSIIAFVVINLFVTLLQFLEDKNEHDYWDYLYSQYFIVWNRNSYYYTANGFVPLVIHSALSSVIDESELSEQDENEIAQYFASRPVYTDNHFAVSSSDGNRPNLILLVVESLNSWGIDISIDNKKVAPTLDSLSNLPSAIVGLKMKTQVKNGRSSDGLFIYNTGILPLMSKTVAMAYSDTPYPSLPRALKGYRSVYMCCDDPLLWNKTNMAEAYGYDIFLSHDDFSEQLHGKFQFADSILLQNATNVLDTLSQPFMAMITTTGMHSPYNSLSLPPTDISKSKQYTLEVRNYLERLSFFDRQLVKFLLRLRNDPRFENCIIAIVSDHSEFVDSAPQGRQAIDAQGDNCTMIILGTPYGRKLNHVFGQIDVYPTLLDLMGANEYKWKGMGFSLLRYDVNSVAISPDETEGKSSVLKQQQYAWSIAHKIITSKFFQKNENSMYLK